MIITNSTEVNGYVLYYRQHCAGYLTDIGISVRYIIISMPKNFLVFLHRITWA